MSPTATLSTVRTEGGLLPPDLLERVRRLDKDLPGLRPEDYGLAPGERLNDAIVRSWNRLSGAWQPFADRLDSAPDSETTFQAQTQKLWLTPLFQELGYGPLESAEPIEIDDKRYPVSHRASGAALHLVGARVDLDRRPKPGARPAHGMVQEYLNRSPEHLWAVLTNGRRLRLLRDSSSLTRQAYCEFDLDAMFRGQQYADFALLWLVAHATRLAGDPPSTCVLERWSNTALTEGTRALDQLRNGVEAAITALGTGFLADPANHDLRRRLHEGQLSKDAYHHQLLRLVYRLLFLLVAESRQLLHGPDADPEAVERYRRYYSVGRLVELARRQRGTSHGDLWAGLRVVADALAGPGLPALGLTGLGSFLWSPRAVEDLGGASLPNRHLLEAVDRLTTVVEGRVRRAVDYRNLGAEELGSVYESLLELHPVIDGQRFSLSTAAGNERKSTGSYYTPTPLIRVLLDSALDPVLDEAERSEAPEAAILALKVLDPAVGSGHFLIAAAHRIAHRLAAVRSGDSEPAPDDLRRALRDVIASCLHGIDVNPMAVELCKVSLWMEATEPGKPLSFLDHRIVHGNSLLGTTPALLRAGVPDEAFKPLEGDDKAFVALLRKRNKKERTEAAQLRLHFGETLAEDVGELAAELAAIDGMPDDSAETVAEKEARFAAAQGSEAARRARLAADAWCAAFVAPKAPGAPALTDATVRLCATHPDKVPADELEVIGAMADRYGFLHLHLAFPDVFRVPEDPEAAENQLCGWSGGFDVVLGNPPWERVKLQEKEWFASRDPAIAAAPNSAARKRLIAALVDEHPELHTDFLADVRKAEGESLLLRASGRFPLGGRGDVNTYVVFTELMRNAISPIGRVGVVVPTGIATDDTTKHLFGDLVQRSSLVSLYDFENRLKVFPGIDSRIKFCLLTLTGDNRPVPAGEFAFFALDVADLDDPERRFELTADDFRLLNPNTRTCPVFRTQWDAEVAKSLYQHHAVLDSDLAGSRWGVSFSTMFHMSGDSHRFRTEGQLRAEGAELQGNRFVSELGTFVPLYEAKMFHHFDHRWATFEGDDFRYVSSAEKTDPAFVARPRYWIFETEVPADAMKRPLLAFRNVARSTDERTFLSAVLPSAAVGHSAPLIGTPAGVQLTLAAVLASFAFDWVVRQKLGGVNMTFGYVRQFPAVDPDDLPCWISDAAFELTYSGWDLQSLALNAGFSRAPFVWDGERRSALRAEIDAMLFRAFGLSRAEASQVLDSFEITARKDRNHFGAFRTKQLILDRYDAMVAVDAAGEEYVPALDPPPADPSLCHPESTRPEWAR